MLSPHHPRISFGYCNTHVFVLLWLLSISSIIYFNPDMFRPINGKILDWKIRLAPIENISDKIVHLDIDDNSTKEYGLWPWGRELSALIIKRLTELRAKLIVFDIFYASKGKDPTADRALFEAIKDSGIVVSATALALSQDRNPDFKINRNDPKEMALYKRAWPMAAPEEIKPLSVFELRDSYIPLKPISERSLAIGHIASAPDGDGVNRRLPLITNIQDRLFPSISLSTVVEYLGADHSGIHFNPLGFLNIKGANGELNIPVDEKGMFLIHWGRPWKNFKHYSARDVLIDNPKTETAKWFKDKIVIVGVTATGATDMGPTPIAAGYPLSRVHSNAINTMITGEFIYYVQPFPFIVIIAVIFSLVLVALNQRYGLMAGIIAALSGFMGYFLLSVGAFVFFSHEAPIAEFFALALPCAVVTIGVDAIKKEIEAKKVSRALERYLSPEMLKKIIKDPNQVDLSTKRMVLTVMFVDMVGFTKMSQTMEVESLTEFLNDYFECVTEAIFEEQGAVDKFLGDGIMAFFGEPIRLPDHAQGAVSAAIKAQQKIVLLNERWRDKNIAELANGIKIRIGINTGPLVVGNVGSNRRLEYTCLGSTVNVASRLQTQATEGGITISSYTRMALNESFNVKGPRWVQVKGIDEPLEVYDVLLPDDSDTPSVIRGD